MAGNFTAPEPTSGDVSVKQGDQVNANGKTVSYPPGRAGYVKGLLASAKAKKNAKKDK